VRLRPGQSAIDLGCGPRGILDLLAERVSPGVVFSRNGADMTMGRRVPELFRQAGLADVEVEARVQMYPPGNSRRTVRLDLVRAMRPMVLEMGVATEAELDELDAELRPHLIHPGTVTMSGLLFLTWGRKPA